MLVTRSSNAHRHYKHGHYHQHRQVLKPSLYQVCMPIWTICFGKNTIKKPNDDRDPYPWIIWYIWKAGNDKLFMGIDRDSLELVRYAESECHAWYNAKDSIPIPTQAPIVEETQALSLDNICMLDGSWTSTDQFSGIGWVWKDSTRKIQLIDYKDLIAMIKDPQLLNGAGGHSNSSDVLFGIQDQLRAKNA
uniref:Uncharacterized protein n=1 Tax=Brassica oleracea var. oleracea TaxID=109376 RepID=A0A0D3AG35_BRAOL